MKKEKILWASILVLIALNVACLAFILLRRPERPHKKFDKMVIEHLKLDDEQIARFNQLKHTHRMQMDRIDEKMKGPFEQYFGLLNGNRNSSVEDSLESVIAALYKQKVDLTYSHFAEIKAMCSPEQQKNMALLVPSLMQVISVNKKNEPGRGK
jgi:periplasmic protein CpxP/Spy